jgi:uncharacterized protein (DUF2336 family)
MFGFLKKIIGQDRRKYAAQKKILESGDPAKLRELAQARDTHPEILYFLARTGDASTRNAVALNPSTPVQAASLLANDESPDVRLVLAARIVELLPDLSPDRHGQLYAYAVQALGMLAQDEVFRVRKALSSALRDYAKAPPAVVSQLARDVEREIAEPILRFCVALRDEDLLEILSRHPEKWAVAAIAARPQVSEEVSEAVIDTGDEEASQVLLGNMGAKLSPQSLQSIIDRARHHPEWHRPLAMRTELSVENARQLTGYVSQSILDVLKKRGDFDAATRQGILAIVQRRMEYQQEGEDPAVRFERYARAGKLTPEVILDALSWQEQDFVILALAHLGNIPVTTARRMLTSGSAKSIVALCWRAKLPVRLTVEVQRLGGKLQPRDLLYPKGGTDYPMTPDELRWQLEFWGIRG